MPNATELGPELGGAHVAIRLKMDEVDSGVRQVETKIQDLGRRSEAEHGEGGLMSHILFGRHGPEGLGHGLEHAVGHAAFGHFFRLFAMGGVISVGAGMLAHSIIHLGHELLSSVFGWEEHAKAVETAAEAYKRFQEAATQVTKTIHENAEARKKEEEEKTGPIAQVHEALHPIKAEEQLKSVMESNRKEAERLRKEAQEIWKSIGPRISLPKEEWEGIMKAHGVKSGWNPQQSAIERRERLAAARKEEQELLEQRRRTIAGPAEAKEARADFLERTNEAYAKGFGIVQSGISAFHQITGGFSGAVGRGLLGAGQGAMGVLERAQPGANEARVRERFGQEIIEENRRAQRQRWAEEEERKFRPMGGAVDVAQLGQQIQAAILEPSQEQREQREHRRKLEAIMDEMRRALDMLAPANQLKGREAAIRATLGKT